jgi:hypothetical protein
MDIAKELNKCSTVGGMIDTLVKHYGEEKADEILYEMKLGIIHKTIVIDQIQKAIKALNY